MRYTAVGLLTLILFFFVLFHPLTEKFATKAPQRFAVFPFLKISNGKSVWSWESLALADLPIRMLQPLESEKRLFYEPMAIAHAAILDSLEFPFYAKDFAERVNLDLAVFGRFRQRGTELTVEYQIYDVKQQIECSNRKTIIDENGLFKYGRRLSEDLLKFIVQGPNSVSYQIVETNYLAEANYYNSLLYELNGQLDRALQLAQEAVKMDSLPVYLNRYAELLLNTAERRKNSGGEPVAEFKRIRDVLQRSLAIDENNSKTLRLKGELYLANERWSQAETALKLSHQHNPFDARTYLDFTRLHKTRYAGLGYKNEGALLERAIHLDPYFTLGYLNLANFYTSKNRLHLALHTLQKLLRINPISVDGLMALGQVYLSQNDLLNVLETYQKVVELTPENSDVYYNIGIVYYHQKDYENAIKYFKYAIELDDHLDSHLYLAYIYEIKGDFDRAIPLLQSRIRKRRGEDDTFAEEARKHLYKIMQERGVIDSLQSDHKRSIQ